MLCNPWLVRWDELRPSQVIRIDLEGNLLEGDWPAPLGIPLHLQLHKMRDDVKWAMHNHPLFGTVWSDMGEVPPIFDQSSALGGGGELVLVNEYDGPVNNAESARNAIAKMGGAARWRCWPATAFSYSAARPAPCTSARLRSNSVASRRGTSGLPAARPSPVAGQLPRAMKKSDGEGFIGFWESSVRAELRADPGLLDQV